MAYARKGKNLGKKQLTLLPERVSGTGTLRCPCAAAILDFSFGIGFRLRLGRCPKPYKGRCPVTLQGAIAP